MNIFNSTNKKIKNFLDNENEFFYQTIITIDETIHNLYENYIYYKINKDFENSNNINNIIQSLNKKKISLIKSKDYKQRQKMIDIADEISKNIENIDTLQIKINQHYIKIINDLQKKLEKKNLIIKQKIDEINEMYFYDLY